jgi:hypothetical protein
MTHTSGYPEAISSLILQTTGIDYRELAHVLRNHQWKEANDLTRAPMLKVMNTSSYLSAYKILQFPGEDLKQIDHLWVQHSDRTLGFCIQKLIWQECGSPGPDYEGSKASWIKFGQRQTGRAIRGSISSDISTN